MESFKDRAALDDWDLDGPEVIDVGADTDEDEDLPWWKAGKTEYRKSRDYIDDLWGDYGFKYSKGTRGVSLHERAAHLVTAHQMVKGFVDTFATGDLSYDVSFDPRVPTAGTDIDARRVVISPAPVLDPTLDAQEAGLVLTGMAVHEASHVRYGRGTANAVRAKYRGTPQDMIAHRLSNILDDVRIEQEFIRDYPGYDHVFKPTIDYVAKGAIAKSKTWIDDYGNTTPGEYVDGDLYKVDPTKPVEMAGAAIRYQDYADWTGQEEHRDWWQAWAARWVGESAPAKHVQGVDEGVAYIMARKQEQPPEPQDGEGQGSDAQKGDGQAQGGSSGQKGEPGGQGEPGLSKPGGGGSAGKDKPKDAQDAPQDTQGGGGEKDGDQDAEKPDAGQGASEDGPDEEAEQADPNVGDPNDPAEAEPETPPSADSPFKDCLIEGAYEAATSNGVDPSLINGDEAQKIVNAAKTLVETPSGHKGDVNRASSLRKRAVTEVPVSDAAASAIRNAFIRSRSGHTGIDRGMPRGRVDNKSLHKIAFNDPRLFHRRTAPDPGRFLVWLLIDRSGSMNGTPTQQTIAMTKAFVLASRSVPTMRVAVWGWTTSNNSAGVATNANFGVYQAWQTGDDVNKVDDLQRIEGGGTPDYPVLEWASEAIQKAAQTGERPVIVMMSDGMGMGRVEEVVNKARKRGTEVISVAIGEDVSEAVQRKRYGDKKYVKWAGDVIATARPLANLIGRIVS